MQESNIHHTHTWLSKEMRHRGGMACGKGCTRVVDRVADLSIRSGEDSKQGPNWGRSYICYVCVEDLQQAADD